jgi:hypothetical protein
MSKLSLSSGKWLSLFVTGRNAAIDHPNAHTPPTAVRIDSGSVGKLSREVCALPDLFYRARLPGELCDGPYGRDMCNSRALTVSAVERERCTRTEMLVPLGHKMKSCREALDECLPLMTLDCQRCLVDAMRTLETEYVRLCDAERFLFDRRVRYLQTGEADDDPEFTIVLERVVYATDPGDEVAASVAEAVQKIVAALIPYIAGE